MLAITLLPGEIWRAPNNDAVYHGFDRNLVYTTGNVEVSQDAVDAVAPPGAVSIVNLATTLRRRLAASFEVSVFDNSAVQPFRIGVWSPWTRSVYFVVFGPAPRNSIAFAAISDGEPAPTLSGGVATPSVVGTYQVGATYAIGFVADRAAGVIQATVSGNGINAT